MSKRTLIRHQDIRTNNPVNPGDPTTEEQFSRGRYLEASSNAAPGEFVRISGAPADNLYTTSRIDITAAGAEARAIGVVIREVSPGVCFIQTEGLVDTSQFGLILAPGEDYFIDFDGTLTTSLPDPPPGVTALVQNVGTAWSTTQLKLRTITPFRRKG